MLTFFTYRHSPAFRKSSEGASGGREPEQREANVASRHPLVSRGAIRSWPPVWTRIDGLEISAHKGKSGFSQGNAVQRSTRYRCFLYIDHEGSTYVGCLVFDDEAFCSQIVRLLQAHGNRAIGEIGRLDLSHTL